MSETKPPEEATAGGWGHDSRPPVKPFWFALVGCVYLAMRLAGVLVFAPPQRQGDLR